MTEENQDKTKKDTLADEAMVGKDKRFTFRIIYTDSFGQKEEGEFISRVPSVKDIIQIGIEESNLLIGTGNADAISIQITNMAFMMATLKICLVDYPSWFNLNDIDDLSLLEVVYTKHALVVDRFRNRCKIEVK